MKIVAEQLEKWALCHIDAEEKNLFGRSAFNRYYYAVFLLTREMLSDFKSSWKKTKHASVPELLRKSVKKEVESTLKSYISRGLVSKDTLNQLNINLNCLAELLEEAYRVRCIADYESEIKIREDKKEIFLGNHTLTAAKHWPGRAAAYCKVIRKVWKETGLV